MCGSKKSLERRPKPVAFESKNAEKRGMQVIEFFFLFFLFFLFMIKPWCESAQQRRWKDMSMQFMRSAYSKHNCDQITHTQRTKARNQGFWNHVTQLLQVSPWSQTIWTPHQCPFSTQCNLKFSVLAPKTASITADKCWQIASIRKRNVVWWLDCIFQLRDQLQLWMRQKDIKGTSQRHHKGLA